MFANGPGYAPQKQALPLSGSAFRELDLCQGERLTDTA